MPCPHNEITIVQRSQRQSAVAAAAYQSGEKLFCEYDQQVKHYPEKRGIVHNEILLPANAPPEYADRNTLWNAAEAVEKQWNSQLARRWVLTIPREIPPDQYAVLVREFCQQQFVSKGMIADFAIHDPHPPGHNPHAHVLLTMRAMDEHGKWLSKSRKVYDLDENGERIKLSSGRWKSHKEDTVDWNDQKYCEIWRHEWEVIQNRYLEANDRPERVDLRSYARQGLDIVPTVHEGAAVRQMEKRGIKTNIGNLNREIRAANSLMQSIRQLIHNLKDWITELGEKRKELLAQKAAEEAVFLPNLLMKYMEIRKEERKDWTRAGQNRGTSKDLKTVSEALSYLRRKGLSTVEDLEAFLKSSEKSVADYRSQMKPSIDVTTVITDIEAKLDAMSVGGLLGLWFQSLFVGLTMKALSICIMLVVYGRMIEIYLVTSVAPIPMATMVNHEWGSMGQNYLKSLLALGFQAFLILVCVGIYAVLIQTIAATDDISGAIWACMGYTVLLCFTLFKTGSLAKSVFSAH